MKYVPPAVLAEDLNIALAPFIGGQFAVYLSRTPSVNLGQLDLVDSANGVWTAANGASIKTGGADLQVVACTYLRSEVATVLTFNVKDENNLARTASATFAPPARAQNQSFDFERGYALDLVLDNAGPGIKIKQVVGIASVVGGYRNVSFLVFQLPEMADYYLVGCTNSKKFNSKARQPVGINCGLKTDAYVVPGMEEPGDLTIDTKFDGMHDKLARFNGRPCTALLVGIKGDTVTHDKMVFTQYHPVVEFDIPAEQGEAISNASKGKFVEPLFFVAP